MRLDKMSELLEVHVVVQNLPVLCSCSKHWSWLFAQNGNLEALFSIIRVVWYLA